MISIYLFTKKESIYFLNFICIQFKKKYYLHLLYQKNLLQNFNLTTTIILLAFTKNEWFFTILFTKVSQFDFYLQMN